MTDDGSTMIRSLPSRDGDFASRQGLGQTDGGRPPGARRGRHSRESRLRSLQAALRKINSAWELSQSPLAKYRISRLWAGRSSPGGHSRKAGRSKRCCASPAPV